MEQTRIFRPARRDEAEAVLALYKSVLGTPFCIWNEEYPGQLEIDGDLHSDSLFVWEEEGRLIGAVSIVPENELDGFDCWTHSEKAGEFSRVVLHPDRQGQHLARLLVENVLAQMKKRGYESAHISVALDNIPAQRTYRSLGFGTVGQAEMWGHRFYLCEYALK